ncbi:hypothetical protein EJB05_09637, partial [Eragrostis curvula]
LPPKVRGSKSNQDLLTCSCLSNCVHWPSDTRDWSELPLDALTLVFAKLGAIEVVMGEGLVCHSWLDAAKVPDLWRSVNMARHKVVEELTVHSILFEPKKIDRDVLCNMAKVAVDRSNGQLEMFVGKQFVSDELLKYIGGRVVFVLNPMSTKENIDQRIFTTNKIAILQVTISQGPGPRIMQRRLQRRIHRGDHKVPSAAGPPASALEKPRRPRRLRCAQLRCFWLLRKDWYLFTTEGEALGVPAMHELRSLTLTRCDLTKDDLAVTLDACPHLELLSLPGCYNVDEGLKAKCARIKTLTLPVFRAPDEDEYETFQAMDCARDFDWNSD